MIDEDLLNLDFKKSLSESTLYIRSSNSDLIVVSLYVDDLFITGNNPRLVNQFKEKMMKVFEMTNLSEIFCWHEVATKPV